MGQVRHCGHQNPDGLPSFSFVLLLRVRARVCVCVSLCVQCCDASEALGWTPVEFDSRMEYMNTVKRKRARDGGYKVGRARTASPHHAILHATLSQMASYNIDMPSHVDSAVTSKKTIACVRKTSFSYEITYAVRISSLHICHDVRYFVRRTKI